MPEGQENGKPGFPFVQVACAPGPDRSSGQWPWEQNTSRIMPISFRVRESLTR